MVLFQYNHKIVEERFVWWVVGWRLIGYPLWVVSGILPDMFFLRSVHTFSRFLKSNWSRDFGQAERVSGAKKRVVLRQEILKLYALISE